ncbi:MAG: zf-HC2 domain-containing protein [Phycisphaerales bacterium]|nr:MAG: zf-HC2 domain-containing protein [Phycisphaerales bacterium]
MTCPAYEKLLIQRVAGELSDTDRKSLEGHLQSCTSCSAEARRFAALQSGLSALHDLYAEIPAPFVFDPSNVDTQEHAGRHRVRRSVIFLAGASLSAAAAIVLLLFPPQQVTERLRDDELVPRVSQRLLQTARVQLGSQTPPLWPGLSSRGQRGDTRATSVSTPTFFVRRNKISRRSTTPTMGTIRAPSLILKPRRKIDVHNQQNHQDRHNNLRDGSSLKRRGVGYESTGRHT